MSWQKERKQEVANLQNYTKDIESKLSKALEALGEVSRGYGTGSDDKHQLNIQRLAANALIAIGRMKQTNKPYIWWS